MKQLLFSLSLITVILLGCTGKSQNNSSENNQEADNQPSIKYEAPKLLTFVQKNDNKLYDKLSTYVEFLNNITDFDAIKEAKKKRDNLIEDLAEVLYKFEEEGDIYENPEWDTIETELKQIGYSVAYVEGMIGDLTPTAMLKDKIEKYAPEDYKLYLDIENKYSETIGGEYPFIDLIRFFKVIVAYEKLQKEFPNSEYLKQEQKNLRNCLEVVTNIHNFNDEYTLVYEFTTDPYPSVTEKSELEAIIKNYPNSKYTPIVEKVLQNMSYFKSENNPIFAVVVDKFNDEKQAENKKFEYINNGKDIVHIISNGTNEYYTCHRYYDNKKAAKTALDKIKSDFPKAYIIKFLLKDGSLGYDANDETIEIIN